MCAPRIQLSLYISQSRSTTMKWLSQACMTENKNKCLLSLPFCRSVLLRDSRIMHIRNIISQHQRQTNRRRKTRTSPNMSATSNMQPYDLTTSRFAHPLSNNIVTAGATTTKNNNRPQQEKQAAQSTHTHTILLFIT